MADPRFTTKMAVACFLGYDVAEMEDYRYQPTRTPCAVYAVGNDYYTATRVPKAPKSVYDRHRDWNWQRVEGAQFYGSHLGWTIWQHVEDPAP